MKRVAYCATALLTLGLTICNAHGAGLERPNVVGARAIGIGGGYTAIADDPTAVWHNPAGTAIYGDNVAYVGGELVILNRTYTPDAQSPLGQGPNGITKTISENTAPTFIPIIGATTRFGFGKAAPTRFAFSLLAYDAYGGSISYNAADLSKIDLSTGKPKVQGISSTQITDFEVTPTLAYQVNDVLAVGAGLRIGINNFSVNDTESAFAANLTGSGVGIGGIFGLMVRPHRLVQIGAVYRTPLSASISGSGPLSVGGLSQGNKDFGLNITWPQSAGLGVTVYPHRRILVTAQADWTAWSSIQKLALDIGGLVQAKEMRYMDSYAIHAGVQGVITRFLVARIGGSIDSNAIPDRTVRRENQDDLKGTVAAGLGVHFWKIFLDGAFELVVPTDGRVVSTPLPSMAGAENETGKYKAIIYSAELSAQIRF
ncbi:MAG: rane protein involved in aromatic hydrocarbon degradation [bacterium]|nr:rane protein involved in aromatic hydrocarbon degradation [bacterium]